MPRDPREPRPSRGVVRARRATSVLAIALACLVVNPVTFVFGVVLLDLPQWTAAIGGAGGFALGALVLRYWPRYGRGEDWPLDSPVPRGWLDIGWFGRRDPQPSTFVIVPLEDDGEGRRALVIPSFALDGASPDAGPGDEPPGEERAPRTRPE